MWLLGSAATREAQQFIQADAATRRGLIPELGFCMDPDNLKFLSKYRRKSPSGQERDNTRCYSALSEALFQLVLYGLAFAFFWFLSQRWSWAAFLALGLLLMLGIPAYFIWKRK
jgi:hypothetical protein